MKVFRQRLPQPLGNRRPLPAAPDQPAGAAEGLVVVEGAIFGAGGAIANVALVAMAMNDGRIVHTWNVWFSVDTTERSRPGNSDEQQDCGISCA